MKDTVYNRLKGSSPGVLALFDPDRIPLNRIKGLTTTVCKRGVKGILIGTSLLVSAHFDKFVALVKRYADKPVIIFPGGSHQVSAHADAIFFLSLLSGRNAEFLIGEQIKSVFLVKEYSLEVIPIGYILIESGNFTAVEYISNTRPIPRDKPEIAVAHALAGEYLGMKAIYLEAGSGASRPVPSKMVRMVKNYLSIPLIVGGGIKTKKDANEIIRAGADYIVMGSIIERSRQGFARIVKDISSIHGLLPAVRRSTKRKITKREVE
jgi:phosphoglycerol geranylgeranyltransferase